MIRRLFSYFVPINIHKKNSGVSKTIEVTWNNGQLVIDSKNTNYSYGSLQRILRKGLKYIGFDRIRKFDSILVLGVAGGSVIKTLVEEIKFTGKITGVEIDQNIVDIANKYFKLNEIPNLEIIIDDAFEFVLKTKAHYDLIIIDIFFDTKMPEFLFEKHFIFRISQILQLKGFVIFNTMILTKEHNQRNLDFCELCAAHFKIEKLPRVEQHNELLILQKK
jgi:spermidine synthase